MWKHVVVLVILFVSIPLLAPRMGSAQDCVCRIEGASVNVGNFPEVQKVSVTRTADPLDVRIANLSSTQSFDVEIGSGQKLPLGAISLEGIRHLSMQVTQEFPKTGKPAPVTIRWYVRFHPDDAFFDPCFREPAVSVCTTGFPTTGVRLNPLMPASLSDRLEQHSIAAIPVSIAMIDVVGNEGIIVVDNTAPGPRKLRLHVRLDR